MTARLTPPADASSARPLVFNTELFDERCEALGAATVEQKAALVGVDWSTIHRFRKGTYSPRLEIARRIANALEVSVDDLWKDAE
jgi:DNA-binding XRE family transcriptional regulator